MSDGIQSLYPEQFDELMKQVRQIAPVVGRWCRRLETTREPLKDCRRSPASDLPSAQ